MLLSAPRAGSALVLRVVFLRATRSSSLTPLSSPPFFFLEALIASAIGAACFPGPVRGRLGPGQFWCRTLTEQGAAGGIGNLSGRG